jgi:ribonuclease VapC
VIVLDTSALMALLLAEPEADRISEILKSDEDFKISAGTLAEALIVAGRRGLSDEMSRLLEGLGVEIETVSAAGAIAVSEAYSTWGQGYSSGGIELGDCFSYVTAKANGSSALRRRRFLQNGSPFCAVTFCAVTLARSGRLEDQGTGKPWAELNWRGPYTFYRFRLDASNRSSMSTCSAVASLEGGC